MEKIKRERKSEGVYKEAIATSVTCSNKQMVRLNCRGAASVVEVDSYESEPCLLHDSVKFPIALRKEQRYGRKALLMVWF
jgi:hypothetical protein